MNNTKLIYIDDPLTYPDAIHSVIQRYIDSGLLASDTQFEIETSVDVETYVFNNMSNDNLYNMVDDIVAELQSYSIVGYHLTRLFDVDAVKSEGLINNWNSYSSNIINVLSVLGVNDTDIKKAIDIIQSEYKRKYQYMPNKICFYVRHHRDDVSYAFCENIGGEIVRWSKLREHLPDVYNLLSSNGFPVVVGVAIPFDYIASFLKEGVAKQFIFYYVSKTIWGFDYKIYFDCIVERDISKDYILQIQKVEESGV